MQALTEIEIAQAVAIIRKSAEVGDEGVYRALVEAGFDRRIGARLVELLPAAYCRVLLDGPRFSDSFQRRRRDGSISSPTPLASEPVWIASLEFARKEIETGIDRQDKLNVAARSAEFHAINGLLNGGSKLENIVLPPAIFQWPEEGPDGEDIPARSTKPWWRL
jgi:hypothetical protein